MNNVLQMGSSKYYEIIDDKGERLAAYIPNREVAKRMANSYQKPRIYLLDGSKSLQIHPLNKLYLYQERPKDRFMSLSKQETIMVLKTYRKNHRVKRIS